MPKINKKKEETPSGFHPFNPLKGKYNFDQLRQSSPEIRKIIITNPKGEETIDFANPESVKMLNKALLKFHFGVRWDIPKGFLCPPVPGRADYLHYAADLLYENTEIPVNTAKIICLDIGVGANCIYPLIGTKTFGWKFIGSDIDLASVNAAKKIVDKNKDLSKNIDIRLQPNAKDFFKGIIKKHDLIDLSICNPPFFSSFEDAQQSTIKKQTNLTKQEVTTPVQNFGGQSKELWCKGGEQKFVIDMAYQSKDFRKQCMWFTSLIAKKDHLKHVLFALERLEAVEVRIIPMNHGNKISRIVAWSFLNREERDKWKKERWH